MIHGSERSPEEGRGDPLQYSRLENPHGQRSLVGYRPWGLKESDMTEQLTHTQSSVFKSVVETWDSDTRVWEERCHDEKCSWFGKCEGTLKS